jgi:hypothetical protein
MKFKIGDKVRVTNMNNTPKAYGDMTNKIGIIKWNAPSEWDNKKYGIAFEDIKNHSSEKGYFYFFKDNLELIHNKIPTLLEIREKKLTCVVHTKSKTEAEILIEYMPQKDWAMNNPLDVWDIYAEETGYYIEDGQVSQFSPVSYYKAEYPRLGEIYELEEMLEPLDADGGKIAYAPNGAPLFRIPTPEKPVSIDIQPLELVYNKEQAKELAERLDKELAGLFNAFPNNGISAKNGGKNSMKFTIYCIIGHLIQKTVNRKNQKP